jgi:adenylate kinase family enzyme
MIGVGNNMPIISFVGPPGCGKTTQIQLLKKSLLGYYDTFVVSVPYILNKKEDVIKLLTEDELSIVNKYLNQAFKVAYKGYLAPIVYDKILLSLAKRLHDQGNMVIMDGSPRGFMQAEYFLQNQVFTKHGTIINLEFDNKSYEYSVSRQFARQALEYGIDDAISKLELFQNKANVYHTDTVNGLLLVKESGIPILSFEARENASILHQQILNSIYDMKIISSVS